MNRQKKRIGDAPSRILGFANWPDNLPRAYVAVLEGTGRGGSAFYTEVLQEYIEVALQDLQGVKPLYKRKTHLIVMPLLGSGHGGGRSRTGELVRALMVRSPIVSNW